MASTSKGRTFVWLRRDLRLRDHRALSYALENHSNVLPLFIFDKKILGKLPPDDHRVSFLHETLSAMNANLNELGSTLQTAYTDPILFWNSVENVEAVYFHRDYEPYALKRDAAVKKILREKGILCLDFQDHVLREANEVLKDDGKPYTVFTPYKNKWRKTVTEAHFEVLPDLSRHKNFLKTAVQQIPSLKTIGFEGSTIKAQPMRVEKKRMVEYDKMRDIPSIAGTTRVGVHLRFGTIGIREFANTVRRHNDTLLDELIWRDFYSQILANFPHVAEGAFRPQYENVEWTNNEAHFKAWCEGKTGYPMVDAGMRELNATGFMHNRARMITASFLTKHLLIDWRWGEHYFAEKLFDFDLASNNGGWQWASSSGTDAAPYFRVFSPERQRERFDKKSIYVKKWVPEYGTDAYPAPIVEHKSARQRAIDKYKEALA